MRCPVCDGAMVMTGPEPRCVRCGVAPVKPVTLAELLAQHKPKRRPKRYHWESDEYWLGKDYFVAVLNIGVSLIRSGTSRGESSVLVPIDWSADDLAYWSGVRSQVYALIPGRTDCGRLFWKRIREGRCQRRLKRWQEALPAFIVGWATEALEQISADYECVDNWRVARVGSTPQMRRYNRQVHKGCCGSKDFRLIGPDKKQYTLGFNYGH